MHPSTNALGKILRTLADGAAGLAAAGIILIVLLQIAARAVGVPLLWTEEATRFLFVWMVFLGLAAGFRTVETARVTVLISKAAWLSKHLATPIYVTASSLFFVVMGCTGWTLVKQQHVMHEMTATLAVPMWAIGLIVPLSSLLALAAIADSLVNRRHLIALPENGPLQQKLNGPNATIHQEIVK